MSRLLLYFKNEKYRELNLVEGREYIVGRGETCDLILPPEKGVSRQHFKIKSQGGFFSIEVLSKFGEFFFQNQKVPGLTLDRDLEFSVPPFQFKYVHEVVEHKTQIEASAPESEIDIGDKTQMAQIAAQASLRLLNERGELTQTFRLEGQNWIAGREMNCAIFIDQPQISRQQFEINKNETQYFIRNLGQTQKTMVNSREIPDETWTPIQSGDLIHGTNWSCQFEIRDAGFEQQLIEASPYLHSPVIQQSAPPIFQTQEWAEPPPMAAGPTAFEFQMPPMDTSQKVSPFSPESLKKNWIRVAIGVLIVCAGLGSVFSEDEASSPIQSRQPATKVVSAFDKLKPEQQQAVRQSYALAKELFMQGRYEMARQEIVKLTQLVPYYEDSRELESSAAQAIQMQQEKEKLEAQEKEKQEIEEKIQRQLQICQAKVHPKVEVAEIDECLSPVIQFNPEHAGILALKQQVDQLISDRHLQEAKDAEYQSKVQQLRGLFEKAKMIEKSGQDLKAIDAYHAVVRAKLPDPKRLKDLSKKQLEIIQDRLAKQIAELEAEADQSFRKGDLKAAILSLKKAVLISPENEVTKGKVASMLNELKKQMQGIYQEAILEESVGEVETARTKWRKILDLSLPEEDYFKKATMKLKKYGPL